MNPYQARNANLPIHHNLTLIYSFSIIIGILMAAASVTGILYSTITYPTDDLLQSL